MTVPQLADGRTSGTEQAGSPGPWMVACAVVSTSMSMLNTRQTVTSTAKVSLATENTDSEPVPIQARMMASWPSSEIWISMIGSSDNESCSRKPMPKPMDMSLMKPKNVSAIRPVNSNGPAPSEYANPTPSTSPYVVPSTVESLTENLMIATT